MEINSLWTGKVKQYHEIKNLLFSRQGQTMRFSDFYFYTNNRKIFLIGASILSTLGTYCGQPAAQNEFWYAMVHGTCTVAVFGGSIQEWSTNYVHRGWRNASQRSWDSNIVVVIRFVKTKLKKHSDFCRSKHGPSHGFLGRFSNFLATHEGHGIILELD